MFKTSPVIKGTIILTLAGIITKIIGFFFKIYLSYIIGAKGIGIYQLIFPIYLVCITISCLGIETSISKYCAEKFSQNDTKSAKKYLFCGLFLSLILSLICSLILHFKADFIAINIIHEKSCAPLLSLLAYAIPFAAVHSCINGFHYARKKTTIPAITQLVEQIARVSSVYIISAILIERSQEITPQIAVLGIVMGEIASTLFSLTAFSISPININNNRRNISNSIKSAYKNITYLINLIKMTVPLTMNNLIINLLQSYEAIIIPIMLRKCGMSSDEALNMYGILTGMAMPLVFFPSALTNSASIMLLPKIAEANASKNNKSITSTAHVTMEACLFLGIFFTGIFFMYGKEMGIYIFSSETAGRFIRTLYMSIFIYVNHNNKYAKWPWKDNNDFNDKCYYTFNKNYFYYYNGSKIRNNRISFWNFNKFTNQNSIMQFLIKKACCNCFQTHGLGFKTNYIHDNFTFNLIYHIPNH